MRLLIEGANLSLAQDLKSEYRLSQRFMQDNDFYEGVRAGMCYIGVQCGMQTTGLLAAVSQSRHRASTSMYSLTFCVRVCEWLGLSVGLSQ